PEWDNYNFLLNLDLEVDHCCNSKPIQNPNQCPFIFAYPKPQGPNHLYEINMAQDETN
ncbi:31144_t:CDS:1, partial [Gigaspora margarita]